MFDWPAALKQIERKYKRQLKNINKTKNTTTKQLKTNKQTKLFSFFKLYPKTTTKKTLNNNIYKI